MPATLLIVDDEKNTREGLYQVLENNYNVHLARDVDEACKLLEKKSFDIVLTDLKMAGKSGMSVIDYCFKMPSNPVCIMITAYSNIETAVKAVKKGAFDFLKKPINLEKLEITIKRALKYHNSKKNTLKLSSSLKKKNTLSEVIGCSSLLTKTLRQVKQVSLTKSTVLITGETGTGKELIAKMIHQNSDRSNHAFVPINCAAISSNLLESELFGHEKGAFTGALERRIGRFEVANKGTLFLDEIGEIDMYTQVKLLRFLESKTFERVGSTHSLCVDVRIICATNCNLEEMIIKKSFREDLYYRLNVIEIKAPALRERSEDILILLNFYIKKFSQENKIDPLSFTENALQILKNYSWPGNIRELRNFAESVVVMQNSNKITENDLDKKFQINIKNNLNLQNSRYKSSSTFSKEENDKNLIHKALTASKGNRTQASKLLNISRRTLHRKLKKWPDLFKLD